MLSRPSRVVASQRKFLDRYQDWQTFARRYARTIGLVRFAAGITSDTCARCILLVEERDGNGDWNETQDARLRGSMLFDAYRSETADAPELVRAQAWHYQVAGEMLQVVSDGAGGADWGIYSTDAVLFDRPKKGLAMVRLVPGGRPEDGTAFVVPREQVVRFWLPDEEYPALATSPMAASIADLHKLWAIGRVIQGQLDSRIAMDGVWWTPAEAHEGDQRGRSGPGRGVDQAASKLDEAFTEIARRRFEDVTGDDVASVVPFAISTPGRDNLPSPKWIKVGDALNKDLLEFEAASRMNFARGINLPGSLAAAGGPGDTNHWTEWLVDRRFFDSVTAPVMNRVTHLDMTRTFLVPVLRMFRLDPNRFRIGYDPAPVIVEADKSQLAIKLNAQGILSNAATLEACNFDPNQIMGREELARLLEILARGREYSVADPTGAPLRISPAPPTSPQGLPGGTQPGPPAGGTPPSARLTAVDPTDVAVLDSAVDPRPEAVARANRVIARAVQARRDAGRALRATAEQALEEALRRAGVKVQVRARNRKPLTASARDALLAAVDDGRPLAPLMAAVGLVESDVLGHAFETYETQAAATLRRAVAAQRAVVASAGLDPDDVLRDDPERIDAATGFLVAALIAIARTRLAEGPFDSPIGEASGAVPASIIASALSVASGQSVATHAATPDEIPTLNATDAPSLERSVADGLVGDGPIEYGWEWGFYADPARPYEIHEDLGASDFTTTMPGGDLTDDVDPDLPDDDFTSPAQPQNHDGCSCEWIPRGIAAESGPGDRPVQFPT